LLRRKASSNALKAWWKSRFFEWRKHELRRPSPEAQEELKACTSSEDVLELAKKVGMPLSDQDLEAIAGGAAWCTALCQEVNGCSYYNPNVVPGK
jgi:hypothetical protein